MQRAAILQALRGTPHFHNLGEGLIEAVAALCTEIEASKGQAIFLEGETCGAFFLVLAGRVKVFRVSAEGREQVVHDLKKGATFAEAALLNLGVYPASAMAEEPTQLLRIDGPGFLKLFREHERLASAMVASLSHWLLDLVARVEELSVVSAGARLAHYLVRVPSRTENGVMIVELSMSKKELAAYLSITPETLSRMLRRWNDRGIIEVDRRKLTILDGRVLAAIADREEQA